MSSNTILIIEDQVDIMQLIKMTLSLGGYETHEAFDAQMGFKMIAAIKPDIILLDVMMPSPLEISIPEINNGLDLCRHLKKSALYSSIPIILLSAKGQVLDVKAGLEAGADHYLVKPFSPIQLLETIKSLIN